VPEGAEYAEVSSEYVPEEPEAPASTVEAYEQATDEDTFASGDDEGTPRRPK
jgi:hypothetical protein